MEIENVTKFVTGRGHRKTLHQWQYQEMESYLERLKTYAKHIEICGESRNSYAKTDHDATFMRIKRDYMGNDQLLPAYNVQVAICDEYIAMIDAKPYASDQDCFVPLMEKFRKTYGHYPKYPVADVGYGFYNNYLYCEEHGMEKYMKSTMFEKETKNEKYHTIMQTEAEALTMQVHGRRNRLTGSRVCLVLLWLGEEAFLMRPVPLRW